MARGRTRVILRSNGTEKEYAITSSEVRSNGTGYEDMEQVETLTRRK